ncbi:LysR family transcriptional regulator [Maridesulfovibrio sp.]|uniref:LysR family transcriptional regulator n=1 Tax=Maridesulfovibrio sp. TaxID=2795000 RepID=UPI0029F5A317|nr:LysR family transcriptional regulator [Maridesulfovibrio sp.]
MEIRYLRLIKAIVEEGGITKATSRLHLTQSALSRQLQEAESQLGAKIFFRVNKKLIPTEAGKKLLQLADEILDKIERTEQQIKAMAIGETGEIRISTECYTSYHWLPATMRKFQRLYPNVKTRIVMEATHNPIEKLLDGELDLAITSDPIEDKHIRYIKLFKDEMFALIPSGHKFSGKKFLNAHDFSDQNLIIHSLPMDTVSIHKYILEPAGVTPAEITILPLTEATVEMVRAEMGITVMAGWAMAPYLKSAELKKIRITPKGLIRDNYAAMLIENELPEYFEYFIDFLRTAIQEHG